MSEFEEFFPFEGPLKVNKPNRKSTLGKPRFHRAKSTSREFDKPVDLENEPVPGSHDYRCLLVSSTAPFRNTPGFASYKRTGTPCGMVKQEAEKAWKIAREEAKELVERIMSHHPTDDDYVAEALTGVAEIARGPNPVRERLAAYQTLLKHCKAPLTTKQELTINTAESWLASLDAEPAEVITIPGDVAKGE